jgi:Tfp pilus assembly protein PilF
LTCIAEVSYSTESVLFFRAVCMMATLSLSLSLGCSGRGAPGAQSPERQSDAEFDLANDFFHRGQPRAALDHARKAIELNDENKQALYLASAIHLYFCDGPQGLKGPDCRLADAEGYARRAVKADAQFREAKNLLGQILITEEKPKDAIALLEPLTKDPAYESSYLAWGNLGWAQVQAGMVDQGIASLQNAITQPKFCVGHYRLGRAFEKKKSYAQAEQSFTNAITVESADCQSLQDAWFWRAKVRMAQSKNAEAKTDLERCRDISTETLTGKECVKTLSQIPQ